MIRLEDITLSAGSNELLLGADLHVRPNDKVGLVGRNGTGKTTLLRALTGELAVDAGTVHVRNDVRLGYLPQQAVSGSEAPLWDEARSRMDRLNALEERMESARSAVAAGEDRAVERLGEATEAFRIAGGFAIEERIGEVLHGLGFSKDDWHRPCSAFSGGWQMRIALARLLLSEPNVLLLDEPTNHLDMYARSWLAGYLARYPHALVVVSHDRHLLDRVCTHIAEVRHRTLHHYTGNFTAWRRQRAERVAQHEAAFASQQAEIARLERFVTRFKAKATKAAQAQSRQKQLDRMERLEAPEREGRPRFTLPEAPSSSTQTVTLQGASLGYGDTPVLAGVDFVLERGQRVAVLGPNGCGKSTLLQTLAGRLDLLEGRRRLGKDVRVGVFTQDLAQDLPADSTGLDYVLSTSPATLPQRARAALGSLGLPGDMALRPIGGLSGGEKARVALACFAVRPCNLLLLDEPTNHLDAVTVDVLVDALRDFEGGMLFVTHDRFLVEQVATHVLHVHDGGLTLREGVRPEDFEPGAAPTARDAPRERRADDYAERKRRQREQERMRRRVADLEGEIEDAEAEIARLDEAMFACADDWEKNAALADEQQAVRERVKALYAEWEEIEAALEA